MGVLVTSGRAAIASAIKASDAIHVAWGAGDVSWGSTPPAEDTAATGLLNEIGRREATQVDFVVSDGAGVIVLPNGRWTVSPTPTGHLYVRTLFDFADAPSATIREAAVFINTVRAVGVSPGQMYLTPAQVDDPGTMYLLDHLSPQIVRSPTTREQFEYVLTF